jgi:RNA-binding protein
LRRQIAAGAVPPSLISPRSAGKLPRKTGGSGTPGRQPGPGKGTQMLNSSQKKYLKGLAHSLKPIVYIGQKGLNEGVSRSVEEALLAHELFKMKFNEHKEKEQKNAILEAIGRETGCELVGMIGHTAILYRAHPEPEKRTITFRAD